MLQWTMSSCWWDPRRSDETKFRERHAMHTIRFMHISQLSEVQSDQSFAWTDMNILEKAISSLIADFYSTRFRSTSCSQVILIIGIAQRRKKKVARELKFEASVYLREFGSRIESCNDENVLTMIYRNVFQHLDFRDRCTHPFRRRIPPRIVTELEDRYEHGECQAAQ